MLVFGYGSLMNEASLKRSAPDAHILRPATLAGYRRVFNLKEKHTTDSGIAEYYSALNIEPDAQGVVDGVLIEISEEGIAALERREKGYKEVRITTQEGDEALTFIATPEEPYDYVHGGSYQQSYLQICLQGAQAHGSESDFMERTFIGEQSLAALELGDL